MSMSRAEAAEFERLKELMSKLAADFYEVAARVKALEESNGKARKTK